MKRFSLKKLILIVFVLLFLLIGFSFFSSPTQSAPDPTQEPAVEQTDQFDDAPDPFAAPDEPSGTDDIANPAVPEPTEVPEVIVTDTFEIELEETEAIGGF